jgi:hypothetical protein
VNVFLSLHRYIIGCFELQKRSKATVYPVLSIMPMVSDFEALARLVPGEPVVLMSVLYHFCMSVRGEVPVVGRPGKKKYKRRMQSFSVSW